AAAAYKRFAHFAMGLVAENISPKFRKYLGLFSTFCSLLMIAILFYYCFDMLASQIASDQRTATLRMPVFYQGLAIPVGCVLIAIRTVQAGFIDYKKWTSAQKEQKSAGR
ncbi:MAG: TRAP transporter small permease subunit, partial [Elusimicrobiota bacterium]|nr:TRAP transporter small permease subunit [Elusimicrobiota bacterium]